MTAMGIYMRSALIAALLAGGTTAAAETSLGVELNKLEAGDGGNCRAFFLFRNTGTETFEAFEMSLAVLNGAGVIDRLLTIDAAPLPANRTTLKLFEVPETECSDISEVILHDLTACRLQNAEEMDCFPLLDLSSKSSTPLVK